MGLNPIIMGVRNVISDANVSGCLVLEHAIPVPSGAPADCNEIARDHAVIRRRMSVSVTTATTRGVSVDSMTDTRWT